MGRNLHWSIVLASEDFRRSLILSNRKRQPEARPISGPTLGPAMECGLPGQASSVADVLGPAGHNGPVRLPGAFLAGRVRRRGRFESLAF
jgi:hypothetical protein